MLNLNYRKILTGLIVSAILYLGFAGPTTAAQLTVCKIGCEFSTISQAIESAAPGDRITVEKGSYEENLDIHKDLTIYGTGKGKVTVIPKSEGKPIISIGPQKVEVTVRKITVSGSTGAPSDRENRILPDGFSVHGEASMNLEEVIVSSNDFCGIRLRDYARLEAVNSSFTYNGNACCAEGNSELSLLDTRISGNGLALSGYSRGSVKSSTISNHNEKGVKLGDRAYLEISDSKIGTCETCILLAGESFMRMENSSVDDAGDAIRLSENSEATIVDSDLSGSTSGVELRDTTKVTISESRIKRNDHGFSLFENPELDLRNCRIASNDIGIRADSEASPKVTGCGIRFYNNFEGHTRGISELIEERLQDRCQD